MANIPLNDLRFAFQTSELRLVKNPLSHKYSYETPLFHLCQLCVGLTGVLSTSTGSRRHGQQHDKRQAGEKTHQAGPSRSRALLRRSMVITVLWKSGKADYRTLYSGTAIPCTRIFARTGQAFSMSQNTADGPFGIPLTVSRQADVCR